MYFLVDGRASYVLPRFKNKPYIIIEKGEEFGHVDVFGRRYPTDQLIVENSKKKNDLVRAFTCRAEDSCELLNLAVSDLDKMHKEFPEIYDELYNSGNGKFWEQLKKRKNAIKECLKEKEKPADKLTMLF